MPMLKRRYPMIARRRRTFKRTRVLPMARRTAYRFGAQRPSISALTQKTVDVTLSGAAVAINNNSNTPLSLLNGISQGAASFNRVGRTVCMKRIIIDGHIYAGNSNTPTEGFKLRIAIVYDRQPNAVEPKFTDIFADYAAAGTTTTVCWSGPSPINKDRFVILYDLKRLVPILNAAGAAVNGMPNMASSRDLTFRINKRLKLETKYNEVSASDITAQVSGALYLVCLVQGNDDANNPTNSVLWSFKSRLVYTD